MQWQNIFISVVSMQAPEIKFTSAYFPIYFKWGKMKTNINDEEPVLFLLTKIKFTAV